MDERSLLRGRLASLRDDLGRAETSIQQAKVDARLRARVDVHFENLFSNQRTRLDEVRRCLEEGQSIASCWKEFRKVYRDCMPLFGECLALLQGALGRTAQLDVGLCAIADALIDNLSERAAIPWGRFTILGEGESYSNLAAIIRIRFPDTTIWSLPLLAHEFGHFVAEELRVRRHDRSYRYPFPEFVTRESRILASEGKYLPERFADLLAVYALGPAPVYASVVLRFDPGTAVDEYHPSDVERVHVMLRVLRLMEEGEPPQYTAAIDYLWNTWLLGVAAAAAEAQPTMERAADLNRQIVEMFGWLTTYLPDLRYDGWVRAQQLSVQLEPRMDRQTPLEPPQRATVADVLNAAWLCRTRERKSDDSQYAYLTDDDDRRAYLIAEKAKEACNQILQH